MTFRPLRPTRSAAYAIFKPGVQSTVSPTAILGQLFPGDPGVPVGGVYTNLNHVSPRLGFALDAFGNGKTVVHGAAGLFFGTISGNMWELPQNFQPFSVRFTNAFSHVVSMKNLYSTDPSDFPDPKNPSSPVGVSPFPYYYNPTNPRYVAPSALTFLQEGFRWPYNDQINFGIQQQLTHDLALSINYVGALNRKLPLRDRPECAGLQHGELPASTRPRISTAVGLIWLSRPVRALLAREPSSRARSTWPALRLSRAGRT